MAIYGESITIQYIAWDTVNNAPKTGDATNHTLRWVKDGTAAAPTNSPSEVDATNAPGVYKLTLTASETQCWVGTLCGKSSSSGVVIMPITLTFERLPTAAPGDTNGLPIIGVAPLTNLDAKISEVKAQTDKLQFVGTDVKATLDNEAVIVGAYATNMSPSEQIQSLGYTSARAGKLDNLDASVSTRLAAASYVAPDNASIAAIKAQTDKLQFNASNQVIANAANLDNSAIASAVWNNATRTLTAFGFSVALTSDYDRAKNALSVSEYVAPDNESITAIKEQTDKLEFVGNDVKATLDDEAVIVGGYLANQSPSSQIQTLGYTAERAEKLDNLDAAISSRLDAGDYTAPDNAGIAAIKAKTDQLTFSGTDVKATLDGETVVVGTNNDKTGYSLVASEHAAIADAVWNEPRSEHTTAGSFGKTDEWTSTAATIWDHGTRTLTAFGFSVTVATNNDKTGYSLAAGEHASIADAVWDEQRSGHTATGSFGKTDEWTTTAASVWGHSTRTLTAAVDINMSQGIPTSPAADSVGEALKNVVTLRFTGEAGSELVLASATIDVDEQAIADAVVAALQNAQLVNVVVAPLTTYIQNVISEGGVLYAATYRPLRASWAVLGADLSSHDIKVLVYETPESSPTQFEGAEITVTYDGENSVIQLTGSGDKVFEAGHYEYAVCDDTTRTVLFYGRCIVRAVPDTI